MLVLFYIYFILNVRAVKAIKWDAPKPYDPVWLASVQSHAPVPPLGETRFSCCFDDSDVEFRLFTRRNPYMYQVLKTNDSSNLRSSNFNFNNKVKVLAHGWLNHGDGPMPESIKEAYLNVSDLNIIVVDWGKPANVNYIWASYNVAMVGRLLTEFLNFLIGEGVSMDDVHLIGHSLGAHVVGIAGAYVKQGPIDTITGLDPALPLFTLGNKDARLDKHDARHVEVIHTCGGYLGFASPLGHIDFYPNGGTRQPGCGFDYRGLCAHNRAHMFFAESIISAVPFTAVRCVDYDELYYQGYCKGTGEKLIMGGFDIHYGKDGIYYLKTGAEKPFALGDVNP
ncbi:pancreatic triacylglycerol lipase-like isoform X1 [Vanessa atalanta]|uniref:pancreatic triacylglycerol lipase-like isoform X1 n=2 Tax=Vanessa atalanta TaxID=42275 RepID=UPI001FCD964D|nr:pancreatic triacylglycerol lipase-like isoform X1 [Vanessa atalanta]